MWAGLQDQRDQISKADQSRDRQLQDAGVTLTDRIMVEDMDEAATLDRFVEHFLARLLTR